MFVYVLKKVTLTFLFILNFVIQKKITFSCCQSRLYSVGRLSELKAKNKIHQCNMMSSICECA